MQTKSEILIVAAHPDDEILGCGGTIARYCEEGASVHILILAEGLTSRDPIRDRDARQTEVNELAETARNAASVLGTTQVSFSNFPDNRMDSIDLLDVVKLIENKIEKIRPSTIFTHFPGDLNIDHQIIGNAVVTAARPIPGQPIREIFFFEVPSSTEWQVSPGQKAFSPNCFVTLSEKQLNKKLEALSVYRLEMREFPHARSLEAVAALAKWRGTTVGSSAAEAFMLARRII